MSFLQTGVIATSLKADEHRVPIHPDHFLEIPAELRASLIFEYGYGRPFGIDDAEIAKISGGLASRDEILANCEISILAKPLAADLERMGIGKTLWGWAHCVQQRALTQTAIDRRLSLITWEGMNVWDSEGRWRSHIFHRNNEIAGYAGVLHATGLAGINGAFGAQRQAAVIGFGSVGRGAVKALLALGFTSLSIYLPRNPASFEGLPSEARVSEISCSPDGMAMANGLPLIEEFAKMDIIVNAILQDPLKPINYLSSGESVRLKPETLIVDVSCDEGMGFPFARPTSFKKPILQMGQFKYYAVDHTPSYLWNSASWEISRALLPYLKTAMSGQTAWKNCETLSRALEIRSGEIWNPQILSFQKRSGKYPHALLQNS